MNDKIPNFEKPVLPVALLVDGENFSAKWASGLMSLSKNYGVPTVRRVYGKQEHIADWAEHGFRLQATRPGKNSADLLLTVEAMSLGLKEAFHTIIVASSDRDFSYLAEHLRELGHHLVGVGESKAPSAYRASCSEFIEFVEAAPTQVATGRLPDAKLPATKIIPLIRAILPRSSLKDGWAYADWIEKTLKAADPGFSVLSFGHNTIFDLAAAVNFFELDTAPNGKLRLRDRAAKPTKT